MIKRIAIFCVCALVALGATGFDRTAHKTEEQQGTLLPILMYHAICNGKKECYVIPPSALEQDFAYLVKHRFTAVTVSDLIAYQQSNIPLPKKPVMLTFDDGNRSNYINVFPLLKKYNLKAVMAVVGAYTDSNYDENGAPLKNAHAYLTYEQIAEMAASGLVEIQNHTYNLHSVGKRNGIKPKRNESAEEYERILSEDLMRHEQQLLAHTGLRCQAVVYPFGAFDKSLTIPVLQKLGYRAALTCTEGLNYITRRTNLFYLKRFNRPYRKSAKQLFAQNNVH